MAEVTGFTAERMRTIENETVVDGEVRGDNLILLTRAGVEIDAGNVRGPVGPQGPASSFDQATADGLYVNSVGDTMTGPLILPGGASQPLHAITKGEMDAVIAALPAAAPKLGLVDFAQSSANQASINAQVDLAGMSVAWQSVAGATYKITGECNITNTTVDGDSYGVYITNSANGVVVSRFTGSLYGINRQVGITLTCLVSPGAVSAYYKLRAARVVGTGTGTVYGANGPTILMVERVI